ncbi:toxin-antitoxin system HicB family antitoxin [Planosporangium sp. 12N6]|uniref:toxin-antitoxin system HicB family antitoxin n=1 Tax=Planosporangium spinosum TaxID=3402278 RepID=UPI003CF62758
MDLSPYLEALRRDLAAAAAPGGPDVTRAADLLAGSLEASARLCLLEALSDATAEITTRLDSASVEVRLRGREADLVVTETPQVATPAPAPPPATDPADLARVTLRLPEQLKGQVERAAAAEGVSVNAWLVRAIGTALHTGPVSAGPTRPHRGRRITGFAQS